MDLRLDGALGSIEGDGEFWIAEAVHVPEHDGASIGGWQCQEEVGPVAGGGPGGCDGGRATRFFDPRLQLPRQREIERKGASWRPAPGETGASGTG